MRFMPSLILTVIVRHLRITVSICSMLNFFESSSLEISGTASSICSFSLSAYMDLLISFTVLFSSSATLASISSLPSGETGGTFAYLNIVDLTSSASIFPGGTIFDNRNIMSDRPRIIFGFCIFNSRILISLSISSLEDPTCDLKSSRTAEQ